MLELKTKCEAIEKRESERRAMEERKHAEEIAFLKKTNVQLKVCIISYVFFYTITDPTGRYPQSSKEIKDQDRSVLIIHQKWNTLIVNLRAFLTIDD